MELNWSTFFLEIANFLVLVWLLKRFLYRPVTNAIAKRQEKIERALQEAASEHRAGEALRGHYADRLADWEREKAAARAAFESEIDQERATRLENLATELEGERRRREVVAERERREIQQRFETKALKLAAAFASRFLARVAGPDLERRLVEVLLEDLPRLSSQRRRATS